MLQEDGGGQHRAEQRSNSIWREVTKSFFSQQRFMPPESRVAQQTWEEHLRSKQETTFSTDCVLDVIRSPVELHF